MVSSLAMGFACRDPDAGESCLLLMLRHVAVAKQGAHLQDVEHVQTSILDEQLPRLLDRE